MHVTAVVPYLGWAFCGFAALGSIYFLAAGAMLRLVLAKAPPVARRYPPVTILKPLHGCEPGLAASLETFCRQRYPGPVQIIFGLANADGAGQVVRALRDVHSELDAELVVDPRLHGANRKVANIINMLPRVKYPFLVLSDSDIRVGPTYLRETIDALEGPGVGAATCFYRGISEGGFWSGLGAMGISYHFLPNAAFGVATGLAAPCFGATVALKRDDLATIGGFEAFANTLADDYEIGRAIRQRGHRVEFTRVVVDHVCTEESARAIFTRELRWARTIRAIDRAGHIGSVITYPIPVALVGAALLGFAAPSAAVLIAALVARGLLKRQIDATLGASSGPWWLLPLRDCVSFVIFLVSLWGVSVAWRGVRLRVGTGGILSQP